MTPVCDWTDAAASVALRRRVVPIARAGVLAREMCRRGGRGEVAAVFERSLHVRIGDEFLCVGEPAIGNGPLTLIATARVSDLGLCRGEGASISERGIALGGLLFALGQCETWRPPRSAEIPANISSADICAIIARHAAAQSPPDSLARALFGTGDTPLARVARPRVARFETWLSTTLRAHDRHPEVAAEGGPRRATARADHPSRLAALAPQDDGSIFGAVIGLIGLGPGLTPSGDDFLMGALALLGALGQTKIHAALAQAVADAAPTLTSPLSACFLRAAAAGHVGESLYDAVASVLCGNVDAAVAAAHRIGHTSGWDMLTGVATTLRTLDREIVGRMSPSGPREAWPEGRLRRNPPS
jgi:hypothetical protein